MLRASIAAIPACVCLIAFCLGTFPTHAAEAPDFQRDVLPIFRKYCNGCHNARDAEGELILEDYARTLRGGEHGAILIAGKSAESRLLKLIRREAEPIMPPKGEKGPNAKEIAVLAAWIDAGAKPPVGGLAATGLVTPRIEPSVTPREPVVALAWAPDGQWLAVARPHQVEILQAKDRQLQKKLTGHTGTISDVGISADGSELFVAAGEVGLSGEITLWKTADWSRYRVLTGHRDSLCGGAIRKQTNGERLLASAGYDKQAIVWDVEKSQPRFTLNGHHDAVYATAFDPLGRFLATCSGDRTVKLWSLSNGERLETFAQPTKEQSSVAFSPDGKYLAAGGVDNRLRIWQLSDDGKEGTNPLLYARFAHEGPLLKVLFSPDGKLLATSSADRRIKLWETRTFTEVAVLARQPDWAAALAFSPDGQTLLAGRMNGELSAYPLDPRLADSVSTLQPLSPTPPSQNSSLGKPVVEVQETEPNDEPGSAQRIELPALINGGFAQPGDVDLYRFEARAGETWMLETNASRSGSAADTKLEVLSAAGTPVLRAQLQAVRDSWITFRGIDSNSLDVRLEYWEEMDLNQFLYMNGEICRTFRMPQGPDSGFQLYAANGKRRNYFDTSATTHQKDDPAYIVQAFPADAALVDNGLPVFPLYFQNDDAADRRMGNDSELTFTAPADGTYLVKVTDSRGFGGEKFTYRLTVRPLQPDFKVTLQTKNAKVPAGSAQKLVFKAERIDHFAGPIRIDITNLPADLQVATPVFIEAGHDEIRSVLVAKASETPPSEDDLKNIKITATAERNGETLTRDVGTLGTITIEKPAKITAALVIDDPKFGSAEGGLMITPGTSITAKVLVHRNGFDGDVQFDVEGLPHGIIVDNIGLSGIQVRKNETERQIFLTARDWVPATEVWITAVSRNEGNQASPPLKLRVGPR